MAAVLKLIMMLIVTNITVYIGINMMPSATADDGQVYYLNQNMSFHLDNDLIDNWLGGRAYWDANTQYAKGGYYVYQGNINASFATMPEKTAGGIGGLTTFIDVLATIWSAIKMMWNIAVSPLTLFFNYNVPPLIGLMVGLPYVTAMILGLIWFIRGMPE